jgi:hypothetical protein
VRWTHTLDTWTAEAGGQLWTIGERREEITLHAGGGYVATFPSVDAAKRRARELAQADDVDAALAECRQKASAQSARRWAKMARAAHGPKP